jgi:hypothetical protein
MRAVVVLTDPQRLPLSKEGRRYVTADARDHAQLTRVIDKLHGLREWIGIIDGGSNRSAMDHQLYHLADLVLLPFRDSQEDIRTLLMDLKEFPHALALPSQWPSNIWQLDVAQRTVDQHLSDYGTRVLSPVSTLSATKLLLNEQVPDKLPTVLNNSCKYLAEQMLRHLQLTTPIGTSDAFGSSLSAHSRLTEPTR